MACPEECTFCKDISGTRCSLGQHIHARLGHRTQGCGSDGLPGGSKETDTGGSCTLLRKLLKENRPLGNSTEGRCKQPNRGGPLDGRLAVAADL